MTSLVSTDYLDLHELIHSMFVFDSSAALDMTTPPPSSPCTHPSSPAPTSMTLAGSFPLVIDVDVGIDNRFAGNSTAGGGALFLLNSYVAVHDEETKTQHRHNHDSEASLMTNGPTGASTGNPSLDVTGSSATTTTAATASNTAANSTTTAAGNNLLPAVLHRPPIRPAVTGVSKSKFDLELNPFEQSFSRSSTSIHPHNGNTQNTGSSSEDIRIAYGAWDSKRGRAEAAAGVVAAGGDKRKRSEEEDDDRNNHLHPKMSLSGSSSPNDKTVLPPLSALTSPVPVDPASHFSWAGISSFLRTGPLSPAMLNGPTSTSGNNTHHGHNHSVGGHSVTGLTPGGGFDPSTFRTGFTPGGILAGGVGGAGFTPGYAGLLTGGGGFPMPSPNTAAFLSMVTHGTPGPGTPTGVGRLGTIGAVGQDMQNGGGKMMLSRPTTAGAAGMNGVGTADDVHASGGGMNGDTRRSSGDDSGASASIHTMHQGGQQQQQQQQVAMTPNSLNVLTGVVSRMNSANADEDGMYSASTAGNRQQNSLAHQQSHIGPNDADLAQRLPPPPPHPDHPMHNATDYFVNPTGVQSGGMAGQNGAGVPPHMHAPHSGYVGSHLSHQHPQHLHQQPQQQQLQQQPMSLPPAHLHASSADPRVGVPGGGYPMHHAGGATMANVNPQGAGVGPGGPLNGLFLLSQAHQELGKREEAQRVAGVAPVGDAVIGGADTSRRAVSGSTATGGRKRKSVDAEKPAAGGRGGGSKRSKKNGSIGTQHDQPQQGNGINLPAYQGQTILQQSQALLAQGLQAQAERDAMQEPDDDEDQKMMDMNGGKDGGDGGDGMGKKDGKPETEEEKRKNFLERNRQGRS
jgi:ATF/CREB family transcription factor